MSRCCDGRTAGDLCADPGEVEHRYPSIKNGAGSMHCGRVPVKLRRRRKPHVDVPAARSLPPCMLVGRNTLNPEEVRVSHDQLCATMLPVSLGRVPDGRSGAVGGALMNELLVCFEPLPRRSDLLYVARILVDTVHACAPLCRPLEWNPEALIGVREPSWSLVEESWAIRQRIGVHDERHFPLCRLPNYASVILARTATTSLYDYRPK